jgi:hypothetical protein
MAWHSSFAVYGHVRAPQFHVLPAGTGYRSGSGWSGPEALGEIAEGLAQHNHTDAQFRGTFAENCLRIATCVWG